jgi:Preprotein translocase subunit SecA (ATPase, RNA helicase)
MTGTADTEAFEFQQIYGLEVVVIPTHMPMIRKDFSDAVYMKAKDKFKAILADLKDCRNRGQPILVGTVSIEVSEHLSEMLKKDIFLIRFLMQSFIRRRPRSLHKRVVLAL